MHFTQSFIGQHFAFAAGRTGVLQQLLLTMSDRDRLLGASTLSEAEAILTEIKMTNPIDQGLKKGDDILHAIGAWVRSEVRLMAPENKQDIFNILWLEEDASLLSYLLKKHHGLTSEISIAPESTMAAYDPKALQILFTEDDAGDLPNHLVSFVREAKMQSDVSPQSIDAAVAQYIANVQLKLARTSGSKEIKQYVLHKIDLTNIRTALRLVGTEESVQDHLILGGSIDPKALCGDRDAIITAVEKSALLFGIGNEIRKADDDQNALEHALSDVMANDIAHMWNVPMSIEPVFAFAALTLSQIKLLRVLLIGKRANLGPQDIKHMLPPYLSASHYVLS